MTDDTTTAACSHPDGFPYRDELSGAPFCARCGELKKPDIAAPLRPQTRAGYVMG